MSSRTIVLALVVLCCNFDFAASQDESPQLKTRRKVFDFLADKSEIGVTFDKVAHNMELLDETPRKQWLDGLLDYEIAGRIVDKAVLEREFSSLNGYSLKGTLHDVVINSDSSIDVLLKREDNGELVRVEWTKLSAQTQASLVTYLAADRKMKTIELAAKDSMLIIGYQQREMASNPFNQNAPMPPANPDFELSESNRQAATRGDLGKTFIFQGEFLEIDSTWAKNFGFKDMVGLRLRGGDGQVVKFVLIRNDALGDPERFKYGQKVEAWGILEAAKTGGREEIFAFLRGIK